jgi:hypothetical protein
MVDNRCCDHDRGAAAHQRVERGLDLALRFGIERRGRLVEDQQRRVLEERARDGDPLALPARHARAVLADHRVEALRHRADEVERVRRGPRLAPRPRATRWPSRRRRCWRRRCR